MWVLSLGLEDPLKKEMVTHSTILAWRILMTEEPGRLQSVRLQRVWHNWSDLAHTCKYQITMIYSPLWLLGAEESTAYTPIFLCQLCVGLCIRSYKLHHVIFFFLRILNTNKNGKIQSDKSIELLRISQIFHGGAEIGTLICLIPKLH